MVIVYVKCWPAHTSLFVYNSSTINPPRTLPTHTMQPSYASSRHRQLEKAEHSFINYESLLPTYWEGGSS